MLLPPSFDAMAKFSSHNGSMMSIWRGYGNFRAAKWRQESPSKSRFSAKSSKNLE